MDPKPAVCDHAQMFPIRKVKLTLEHESGKGIAEEIAVLLRRRYVDTIRGRLLRAEVTAD